MSEPLSEEQLITYDELINAIHGEIQAQEAKWAEFMRRKLQQSINEDALPLEELKRRHGQVWTTQELGEQFEVIGFGAPMVVVRRREDNKLGSVLFQHWPRYYWGFKEDRV